MAIPEDTAYAMTILDCHWLKPRTGYPTAIIVKFAQLSDRDFVLYHAKSLKKFRVKTGSHERQQYFVKEHYPMELRDQKNALLPVYRHAAKANMRRSWRVVGTEHRFSGSTNCKYLLLLVLLELKSLYITFECDPLVATWAAVGPVWGSSGTSVGSSGTSVGKLWTSVG